LALRSQLEGIDGVAVVGEASTSSELVQQAGLLIPDVAVVNPRLPGGVVDACRLLQAMACPPAVVTFATFFREDEAQRLRSVGVKHYLLKEVSGEGLAAVLSALRLRTAPS